MAVIDLTEFSGDQVVIHFGGEVRSVDAYTFANALISFADTARAVNAVINPGQNIEVKLEAIGPGSFRARVRRLTKGLGGFFSSKVDTIFWSLVATLIYDNIIKNDPDVEIIVGADQVTIIKDGDKIIIPRAAHDQLSNVKKSPTVQQNLSNTFRVLESDQAVESFGLTPRLTDPDPVLRVQREDFPRLTAPTVATDGVKRRPRSEHARLVITKAWLKRDKRTSHKWSFEWNGVPISAPIKDEDFLDKLEHREYLIGTGDALDAQLSYQQVYDEGLDMYVNESDSFIVERVIRPVPRSGGRQTRMKVEKE